eukprot:COSAG01_NODE_3444_length_6087_cov_8.153140_6_plen_585_part_00
MSQPSASGRVRQCPCPCSMRRSAAVLFVVAWVRTTGAASPTCAYALRSAFGGPPPVAPVPHPAQQACLQTLFSSEMSVRRAGCNTGDQSAFCRGLTGADRGASGPPRDNIHNPGISGGIPKDIDCPIRALAYDYAVKLQGKLRGAAGMKAVHDALQLGSDCGQPFTAPVGGSQRADRHRRAQWIASSHQTVLHVRPNRLSHRHIDTEHGDGSPAHPIGSVAEAVRRAALLPPSSRPVAIVLGGGVHVLESTLELGPQHSNLSFVSAPGERAVVTGAVPLELEWKPYDVDKATGHNIYVAEVGPELEGDITGLRVNGARAIRARYPNGVPEQMQVSAGRQLRDELSDLLDLVDFLARRLGVGHMRQWKDQRGGLPVYYGVPGDTELDSAARLPSCPDSGHQHAEPLRRRPGVRHILHRHGGRLLRLHASGILLVLQPHVGGGVPSRSALPRGWSTRRGSFRTRAGGATPSATVRSSTSGARAAGATGCSGGETGTRRGVASSSARVDGRVRGAATTAATSSSRTCAKSSVREAAASPCWPALRVLMHACMGTGAGGDNGIAKTRKRREISVCSYYDQFHHLHPHP